MSTRVMRPFETLSGVADLVAAFESGTLPKKEWNHRAHLTVAIWYMSRYEEPEASRRMIRGIRCYNHMKGIPASPRGGYHETITLFWLAVVRGHLRSPICRDADFLDIVNSLLRRVGERPGLVREFYSEETLWSPAARSSWVAPDLKPLAELTPRDA